MDGIKYIKIIDNGIGFEADDVEMAFERHATSKIRKEEDLLSVKSMGFRGEALASVAAISRVSLITKNKNENTGVKALVEAGKILSVESIASNVGTKLEIRDVFFNVPARFKFLKKDYTEAGYIEDVVRRIALANPHISFKYINNNKQIIQTTGSSDLKTTIYELFGKEIYDNIIPIEYEHENIKIKGMAGLSSIARSTRMNQYTFLNSRYIKDKIINSAIDKAYTEKLGINKFAFIVLNLEVNPANIDVNVHPAKLEVKFDNENQIFNCVYFGIKTTLENNNKRTNPFTIAAEKENNNILNIQDVSESKVIDKILREKEIEKNIENNKKFDFEKTKINLENINSSNIIKSATVDNVENNELEIKNFEQNVDKNNDSINLNNYSNSDNLEGKYKQEIEQKNEEKSEEKYIQNNEKNTNINTNNLDDNTKIENVFYEEQEIKHENIEQIVYKYIGQVFDTYIIIQIDEKMYIIDQHAAHERLLYEQIKENYNSKNKQTQMMLIPMLIELTSKEQNIVMQNIEMFEKSGFILEEFGDTTIKISGVPNIGYDIEYKGMFIDIIDELLGASKTNQQEKEFRFIATLACKAAVKGNMRLSEVEQKSLIADMMKLENPFTCPHGRPTAYEISKYEIERKFLRK